MTQERRPTGRILYFDLLRILSMFSVVLIHVNGTKFYDSPVGSLEWNILNVYQALGRFSVPVFVMISGAFLLDDSRDYPLKKLYFQKILRIATAFLFWSAVYAVYTGYVGHKAIDAAYVLRWLKNTVVGHYHLWFLYMLMGLYVVSPLLRAVCRQRRTAEYFLALWFVFEIVLNLLSVSERLAPAASWLRDKAPGTTLGYAGYFVLGHYLANYRLPARLVRAIYALGALSLALTIGGTLFFSRRAGALDDQILRNLLPTTVFYAAAVFLFVKRRFENASPSPRFARAVSVLSGLSFGAYLVHDVFLILYRHLGIRSLAMSPVLYVPLFSVAAFGLSLVASHVLSKIPVAKRYIL